MQGNLRHLPQPKGQTQQWKTQRGINPPPETNSLHKTSKAGTKIHHARNISFYPHKAKLRGPLLSFHLNFPTQCTEKGPSRPNSTNFPLLLAVTLVATCNKIYLVFAYHPYFLFHVCATLQCKGGECKGMSPSPHNTCTQTMSIKVTWVEQQIDSSFYPHKSTSL